MHTQSGRREASAPDLGRDHRSDQSSRLRRLSHRHERAAELDAECGVTIHESVHELSAYELNCIKTDTAKMPLCFSVQTDTQD